MQIQPILGYFGAIFGLYQPPGPPFWISPPPFTYPESAPAMLTVSGGFKHFWSNFVILYNDEMPGL